LEVELLEIELRGDPQSLEVLARLPLPDILTIEQSHDGWKLRVKDEDIPEYTSTTPSAERHLEFLNSSGRLKDPLYQPVRGGTVRYGSRVTLAWFNARAFPRDRGFVDDNSLPAPPVTRELLAVGLQHSIIRDVFHFYGAHQLDRSALWKIFELVRREVGGPEALARKGWLTREAIISLRESINNPSFAGELARHPKQRDPEAGAHPLGDEDMHELMRRLLLHWLKSKAEG
jgi:hypothetical protein